MGILTATDYDGFAVLALTVRAGTGKLRGVAKEMAFEVLHAFHLGKVLLAGMAGRLNDMTGMESAGLFGAVFLGALKGDSPAAI